MRTLCLIAIAPLVFAGVARAQTPGDGHLLSEPDEYIAAQNGSQPYWVQPTPQPQLPPQQFAPPPGQYGSGQPYAGQPPYAYGQNPTWADEAEDEEDGDDQYADDAGFDEGWDAEAYTDFESELSPYGNWVDSEYGRVWSPSVDEVGADFSPYSTGGHWMLSDYGWTWVSDYGWGWAPFHYGRWMPMGGYGWCWRPGRTWGPAWVSWRFGGGYVGWHPLPPHGVHIAPPVGGHNAWRFTTATQFGAAHPAFLPSSTVGQIWTHTQPIVNVHTYNGVHVNGGPQPQLVASAAGRAFVPTPIHALAAAAPRASIVPRVTPANNRMPQVAGRSGPTTLGAYRAPSAVYPNNRPLSYQVNPSYRPSVSAPHYAAPTYAPRYATPGYVPRYATPGYTVPHYTGPTYYSAPRYAAPHYSAPSYAPSYNGSSYSAPHYSAPSFAPRYTAPSYSAPHYSAPSYSAPHYSAPSYSVPHVSAPSTSHYSAPSYSAPRGGGFGGGRRR